MGAPRQKKLPEQLTAQLLPLVCPGEKQARIVAKGKTSEDHSYRSLKERGGSANLQLPIVVGLVVGAAEGSQFGGGGWT